jgi:NitT/TauT family transport system ATP-binding protein
MAAARLEVDGVALDYEIEDTQLCAVADVSFKVETGERIALLGPSGCGKSSLLKAVAGFLAPAAGEIRLDGRRIERPGPDRVLVFQEFDQLLPWKTATGNVVFALRLARAVSRAQARAQARRILAEVGLERALDAFPHTLSGGMKQRVAIARALAVEPAILLMDEPFAALDALTRRRMQEDLLALWRRLGFTMLFVTHSIEEAVLIGARVLVMTSQPGRIAAAYDTSSFDLDSVGSERFEATVTEIRRCLFAYEATRLPLRSAA